MRRFGASSGLSNSQEMLTYVGECPGQCIGGEIGSKLMLLNPLILTLERDHGRRG